MKPIKTIKPTGTGLTLLKDHSCGIEPGHAAEYRWTHHMEDPERDKFVVIEPQGIAQDKPGILLSDYNFWAIHEKELAEWADTYNCVLTGVFLELPDYETLVLFKLQWS